MSFSQLCFKMSFKYTPLLAALLWEKVKMGYKVLLETLSPKLLDSKGT